jgi:hypothetical protein
VVADDDRAPAIIAASQRHAAGHRSGIPTSQRRPQRCSRGVPTSAQQRLAVIQATSYKHQYRPHGERDPD